LGYYDQNDYKYDDEVCHANEKGIALFHGGIIFSAVVVLDKLSVGGKPVLHGALLRMWDKKESPWHNQGLERVCLFS
jgi:hypothetical protein